MAPTSADERVRSRPSLAGTPGLELSSDIRVLCVDDDQPVLELTAEYLEGEHPEISVMTATSPTAGYDILEEEEISCVVSDYQMPEMDGIEFLSGVREDHPDLPFILYTGKGSETVASEAISADVTDYLQKGTGTEQYEILANRVERAVVAYRAQRELLEREERFRTLVEGSTDMIAILDGVGRFEYLSPSVERIMGYEPAELVGVNAFDLMHSDDQADMEGVFEDLLADPSYTPTVEFRYEHEDGSWRWLEAHGRNNLEDPTIEGVIVNVRDVTDRKRVERRYRTLNEASPAASMVLNADGTVADVSPSLETLTGYDEAHLVGIDALEHVHPDDRDRVAEAFMASLDGDEPGSVEYRYVHKDGTVRWAQATGRDLRDDPVVDGFVVNALDITARKHVEQRYRTLLEESPAAVFVLDTDGTIEWTSPSVGDLLGYDREEMQGRFGIDFVHPDDQDRVVDEFTQILETGESNSLDYRYVRKDDTVRWAESHGRALREDPVIEGVVVNSLDITERKRVERRYRTLLEESPAAVIVLDEEGTITWTSGSAEEMLGLEAPDLIGRDSLEFVHPDDGDRVVEEFTQVLETEEANTVDYRYIGRDDAVRWVQATVRDLRDDPTIRGLAINVVDITERKERARDLQEEREFIDTVLDTIQDVVYVFDEDGEPLRWNDRANEVLGYTDDELEEMHALDFVAEEDQAEVAAGIERVLEEGTSRTEGHVVTADGETIPYEFRGGRLDAPDGEVLGFCGIARDMSGRDERERRLERLETLLEEVADGVSFVDANGRYSYVNSYFEEKTGYDREELIGASPTKIMSEDAVDRFQDGIRAVLSGERDTFTTEMQVHPANGEPYPVETKMAPLVDDGTFQGNVAVSRDITERKERERELHRQNERLEEFVSVVSHDLRNPLNVAMGRLAQAQSECESEYLDTVANAHDRMDALIEDLLTLAREGEAVDITEPVELQDMVDTCWTNVDTVEATLVNETDGTVWADKGRVRQLLENLIRNAVEHGGEDVTVTVGSNQAGFFVADDGTGIPESDRDRVFDAGYSTAEGGTGLGLRIVDQIAGAHGWEVSVSTSEAGGARFDVTGVDRS